MTRNEINMRSEIRKTFQAAGAEVRFIPGQPIAIIDKRRALYFGHEVAPWDVVQLVDHELAIAKEPTPLGKVMRARGWSYGDVAKLTGLSRSILHAYRTLKSRPGAKARYQMAMGADVRGPWPGKAVASGQD